MGVGTLVLSAIASSAAAAVLITLGVRLRRRDTDATRRIAARAFGTTWILLGLVAVTNAATTLTALAGSASLGVVLVSRFSSLTFLAAALASLSFYLVYIRFGNLRAYLPIAAGYAALLVGGWWAISSGNPNGVLIGNWYVEPAYGSDYIHFSYAAVALGLVVTPIIVLGTYLSLLRHTPEKAGRRRIQVVGFGLLGWLAIAGVTRVANNELAFFVSRTVLGIAVGLAVWLVHFPPNWAVERYGLARVTLRALPARPPLDPRALTQRMDDLI